MVYTFNTNRGLTKLEVYENEHKVVVLEITNEVSDNEEEHAEYWLDEEDLFNLIGALHSLKSKISK